MRDYRAYIVGPDGHIKDRIEFWSEDDEKAKEHAEQYVHGRNIELWRRDKKIAEFKCNSKGAATKLPRDQRSEPREESPRSE